jgi:hypothetical protein
MKANKQAIRIEKALQVIERLNEGRVILDACRLVGLRQTTFEKVCEENPEIFEKMRDAVVGNYQRYSKYITAYCNELRQKLISGGLTEISSGDLQGAEQNAG